MWGCSKESGLYPKGSGMPPKFLALGKDPLAVVRTTEWEPAAGCIWRSGETTAEGDADSGGEERWMASTPKENQGAI